MFLQVLNRFRLRVNQARCLLFSLFVVLVLEIESLAGGFLQMFNRF
jgi:hypothetical protein